jgi:hypothetical protein
MGIVPIEPLNKKPTVNTTKRKTTQTTKKTQIPKKEENYRIPNPYQPGIDEYKEKESTGLLVKYALEELIPNEHNATGLIGCTCFGILSAMLISSTGAPLTCLNIINDTMLFVNILFIMLSAVIYIMICFSFKDKDLATMMKRSDTYSRSKLKRNTDYHESVMLLFFVGAILTFIGKLPITCLNVEPNSIIWKSPAPIIIIGIYLIINYRILFEIRYCIHNVMLLKRAGIIFQFMKMYENDKK